MATLHNPQDVALLFVPLHVTVEPGGSVDIPDDIADAVSDTVWRVESARAATKRTVTRGSKRGEVTAAPAMETRVD